MSRMCAQMSHILVLNSYANPPPPFPKSCICPWLAKANAVSGGIWAYGAFFLQGTYHDFHLNDEQSGSGWGLGGCQKEGIGRSLGRGRTGGGRTGGGRTGGGRSDFGAACMLFTTTVGSRLGRSRIGRLSLLPLHKK